MKEKQMTLHVNVHFFQVAVHPHRVQTHQPECIESRARPSPGLASCQDSTTVDTGSSNPNLEEWF